MPAVRITAMVGWNQTSPSKSAKDMSSVSPHSKPGDAAWLDAADGKKPHTSHWAGDTNSATITSME
jgi:hypothetical protein